MQRITPLGTEEVADHAISLILDLIRKTTVLHNTITINNAWPDALGLGKAGIKRYQL